MSCEAGTAQGQYGAEQSDERAKHGAKLSVQRQANESPQQKQDERPHIGPYRAAADTAIGNDQRDTFTDDRILGVECPEKACWLAEKLVERIAATPPCFMAAAAPGRGEVMPIER